MDIVIFHNPDCSKSRNVVRIVHDAGYAPTVIEYLSAGWTRPQLLALFAPAGLTPRTAMRVRNTPAVELGLLDDTISDDTLLDAMVAHPILVDRPIVSCAHGVRLCRPSGVVLDLLPNWPPAPYYKENGDLLIGDDGMRVPE